MLIKLFLSFVKIGAVSFGGGYAVIAMIQQEIVEKYGIITNQEFIDMVALSEMSPGPLAINSSTFVGLKKFGIIGAIVVTLGVILIPSLLSLIMASYYQKKSQKKMMEKLLFGIRPCIVPIILIAVIKLLPMSFVDAGSFIIAAMIAILYYFKKISPIYLIILGGSFGYIYYGFIGA